MEIEVDSLLSLAGGRGIAGGNGRANGYQAVDDGEDTKMGEGSSQSTRPAAGMDDEESSEELSTEELRSVRVRKGECLWQPLKLEIADRPYDSSPMHRYKGAHSSRADQDGR